MSIVKLCLRYWSGVPQNQTHQAIGHHVARIIREEREKRKLSMTVLAQKSGLSQAMISFIEREIRNPSLETLLRISSVLGVHLDDILRRAREAAARQNK